MNPSPRNRRAIKLSVGAAWVAAVSLSVTLFGAAGDAGSKNAAGFELLPRAFQRAPRLNLTVMTDVTPAGKARPEVTPQTPAYYVAHAAGPRFFGEDTNRTRISADEVADVLQRSLAVNGYLPAAGDHPPTLVVVYSWGGHNLVSGEHAEVAGDAALANAVERVRLIAGDNFARDYLQAVNASILAQESVGRQISTPAQTEGMDFGGAVSAMMQVTAVMDPLRHFRIKSAKNEFILQQASGDCYYVIASAYDYASVARNEKQLLWRTRMTVSAEGVAQKEAVPTMITYAAQYFGREMLEPETLRKRAYVEEKIEIGTPTVVPADK